MSQEFPKHGKRKVPACASYRILVLFPAFLVGAGCASSEQIRLKQFHEDGVSQYRVGNYQGARESFEEALCLKPEDPNLLYNIGQCHDRQGDGAKAEKYYEMCLEKSPNHAECRHAKVLLLSRTGRRDQANRMIQDWLTRAPALADPYAEDAWRLRQDKAYPLAQARLQQALTIDPHNVRALTELGILYEQMEMPERALVLYERALSQNPNQPDIVERVNHLRQSNVGRPLPNN